METPTIKAERDDALFYLPPEQDEPMITPLVAPVRNPRIGIINNDVEMQFPAHETPPLMKKSSNSGKSQISETRLDFPSIKGVFGWTTLDNVNIPYIFRKDRKFVSVRVVEQKLLSRYPNSYPDELGKHQPLTSYFITEHEANLLNEINQIHCGGEFGAKQFNCKDLIVLLEDFSDFYNLVKKTFPLPDGQKKPMMGSGRCGWYQVNNTVTPFVWKEDGKYVPLSVMKYAANLNIQEKGILPTPEECDALNHLCALAGFNFTFSKTTRLISLNLVTSKFPVKVIDLPSFNPLEKAKYLDSSGQVTPAATPPVTSYEQLGLEYVPQMSEKTLQQLPPDIRSRFMAPKPRQQTMPPGPSAQSSKFMDDKMMFSFNRFPFTKYNLPFQGPPNVTVNPNLGPEYPPRMPPMPPRMMYPPQGTSPNASMPFMGQQFSPTGAVTSVPPKTQLSMASSVAVSSPSLPNNAPSMVRMVSQSNMEAKKSASPHMDPSPMVKVHKTVIPPPPHMSGPHVGNHVTNKNNRHGQGLTNTGSIENGVQDKNMNGYATRFPAAMGSLSNNVNAKGSKAEQDLQAFADSIKGLWLSGKSISCMHVNNSTRKGRFCLVEAVCKLYFSGCSVTEFLYALENVLCVSLVTCTEQEEKAFIKYYSLPVSMLKCNKMIEFDDLEKFFPQLSYLFKHKSKKPEVKLSNGSSSRSTSPQTSMEPNTNDHSNSGDLKENKPESSSSVSVPSVPKVVKPVGSLKRKMPSSFMISKQPCKRLEATVQRLMNQQGAVTVTDSSNDPENDSSPPQTPPDSPSESVSHSPTCPQSHSPTHPQSHSPTLPQSHSPTRPQSHSPTHPLNQSPPHPLNQSPTYPQTQSPPHSQTQSPAHSQTSQPSHSPSHPQTPPPFQSQTQSPAHPQTLPPPQSPTQSPPHSTTQSPTHSPLHFQTKSSHHSQTPPPSHSPSHSQTPPPFQSKTQSPPHSQTPPPFQSQNQSPPHSQSQSPRHSQNHLQTQSPPHSPSQPKTVSPSPSQTHSPSQPQNLSPSPSQTHSPSQPQNLPPPHSPPSSNGLASDKESTEEQRTHQEKDAANDTSPSDTPIQS